jgi:hypothetical protein
MGLRDKIKSVFLVEEESSDITPQTNKAQVPSVNTSNVQSAQVISSSKLAGEVSQKIVDELCNVLNERNLPGPDYLEVRNAANALKEILNDDNQALKTAFVTIKTTNPDFTKQIVFDSIDAYIKIVENERLQGKKSLEDKRNIEINARENSISDLGAANVNCQTEIETHEKKISELRTKILKNSESITSIRTEIAKSEVIITKQELDFNSSVDFMLSKLNNDKQNLLKLL